MSIKKQIYSIFRYIVIWLVVLELYVLFRFVGHKVVSHPLGPHIRLDFSEILVMPIYISLVIGVAFGVIEVFFDKEIFKKMSYGKLIIYKSLIYLVFFITLSAAVTSVSYTYFNKGFDIDKWLDTWLEGQVLIVFVYLFIATILINSTKQLELMMGGKTLNNILLGRYSKPREDERVFMFMDLKDSTRLAERLGNIRYSELLQDCFREIKVIEQTRAEIYQYVGDEVVLQWPAKAGIKNSNCLKAYFLFTEAIDKKEAYFRSKYGEVPFFKAGANIGRVTITEVGSLKKEIAFHGDAINTAARVQAMCNSLNSSFLITELLLERLSDTSKFNIREIGEVSLKGKVQEVVLYTVTKAS